MPHIMSRQLAIAAFFYSILFTLPTMQAADRLPNIVFILADDK